MVDRVRVVTGSGLNFRVHPVTGAPVDGNLGGTDVIIGTNTDGLLNGAAQRLNGTAYTQSFAGTEATVQYGLDSASTRLFVQTPPNEGTLTTPVTITDGSATGLALQFNTALEIYHENTLLEPEAAGIPTGFINAMPVNGGGSRLYKLNLTTGVATLTKTTPDLSSLTLYSVPARATLAEPLLFTGMVGENYFARLDLAPGATVTAKGLPPGLKLNSTTGVITGRLTTPGVYVIAFTVREPSGALTTTVSTITVIPVSKTTVGTYTALVEASEVLNGFTGGRLDLTTTTKATYTLKLIQRGSTLSAKGNLITAPGQAPRITAILKGGLTLSVSLEADDALAGTLTNGTATTMITGWRKSYDKTINPADEENGYYTVAIESSGMSGIIPGGDGYASVTVGVDGSTKLVGKAADGSALTSTSHLGPDGEILVFAAIYKKQGAVFGTLELNLGDVPFIDNTITGTVRMTKPATSGRTYPTAIGQQPYNVAGSYLAARATKGSTVLGLPAPGDPASLIFTGAGAELSATPPSLNESVNYALPKVTVPPLGSEANPARTSLSINASTGAISGSFTLRDGNVKRTVKYLGMIIRRADIPEVLDSGYYLLPQIPVSSSPVLSGQMELIR